jgi:predicted aspartyl protease
MLTTKEKGMQLKALFVAALIVAAPGAAQTVVMTPAGTITNDPSVVATGNDQSQRMTVPVMVNGQGPFQFVIDTGADRTVISTELSDRLNLPAAGTARLHSMGGQSQVNIVSIDRVGYSNRIARDVKAAALPMRNLGADGLLGVDSLKGQRVVMDFVAQTMSIESSSEAETPVPSDGAIIVVTARTRLGQLVMVDADANGQKVWVVVDTGAQNSVGNSRLKQLLVKRNPETPIKLMEMVDVIGRRTPAEYTIVSKVRIGGVTMHEAAIAFADAHPFKLFGLSKKPSMLLGMESLRSFRRVSVDFASRKVKFMLPKEP